MSERADDKNGDSGQSNFGALQERVLNIDKRLGDIVDRFDKLTDAIHEVGKTKWTTLTGFALVAFTVLGGLWLLVVIPIKDDIKDLRTGTVSKDSDVGRSAYVDKEMLRLEGALKDKASKDDLNRLIIEIDRRWPGMRNR